MYSIPYTSINMWATENAGISMDLSAEVDLWTRAGQFKINLRRGIDVREFDQIIAEAMFGVVQIFASYGLLEVNFLDWDITALKFG